MKPLYIFDLDGTLALIDHRRPLVERPSSKCPTCGGKNRKFCVDCDEMDEGWKPRWPEFFKACVDDPPNPPVLQILDSLSMGADIWIWSGRDDAVRPETEHWLATHAVPYSSLLMRAHGDHQPDDQLKGVWYDTMNGNDKRRLVATFDDRDRMVKMWRDKGVTCLQVAPGNF